MIYCTAAQQQLCVENKALAPKLFMRNNKRVVAIQSVCRWEWDLGRTELRRRGNSGQSEHFQWDGNGQLKSKESTFARRTQSSNLSEGKKDFLRNGETSALACFRDPVCSVMLFWPMDTSSSITTNGGSSDGRRRDGFQTAYIKCLLLLLSPSVLPVLWVCRTVCGLLC